MAAQNTGPGGTFAPPMPKGLSTDLRRKTWLLQNFKRAREADPPMTQGAVAEVVTARFREAGLLDPDEVILPTSIQRWESDFSSPTGERLSIVLRWMVERLGEQPPVPVPPPAKATKAKRAAPLPHAERKATERKH